MLQDFCHHDACTPLRKPALCAPMVIYSIEHDSGPYLHFAIVVVVELLFSIGIWWSVWAEWRRLSRAERAAAAVIIVVWIPAAITVARIVWNVAPRHDKLVARLQAGNVDQVEGDVIVHERTSRRDRFSVGGQEFRCSRRDWSQPGFNEIGVVPDGRRVRIEYWDERILRLTVLEDPAE
jgi:hypothetical protein